MQLSTGLTAALVAGALAAPPAHAPAALPLRRDNATTCKCYADDPCWPTDARWQALNQAVQGRLSRYVPPAAACFASYHNASTANADACQAIQANWTNPSWIVEQAAQPFSAFWNNDACAPGAAACGSASVCGQGLSPQMAVVANNQFDVQVSVNFARIQSLRLVIRNTGHDSAGRSAGYGSLTLNTHRLANIQFIKAYSGAGNYTGGAAKLGAGVVFRDLYPAAAAEGVDVVGADSETVGMAGGYIQGGGHSPLSGLYGLAADNALEFGVILASGKQVQVHSGSYPDLFWALKGGGPGNYAAVTSVTVKTHPAVPCVGATLNITYAQPGFWPAVAAFHAQAAALADAGIYVRYAVSKDAGLRVLPFVAPNMTVGQFGTAVAPLLAQLSALNATYAMGTPTAHARFNDLYQALFVPSAGSGGYGGHAGTSTLMGGRLLSTADLAAHGAAIASALAAIVEAGHTVAGHVVSPGRAVPDPDAASAAVNPVWRRAALATAWLYETPQPDQAAVCAAAGAGASEAARKQAQAALTQLGDALRKASPTSGVYPSEGDPNEPGWQQAFWGANYQKLVDIKTKYDPAGVFWVPATPGAEAWTLVDEKRLCKA